MEAMLLMAMLSQPLYGQTYCAPTDYVYLELGNMSERTRRYEVLEYTRGWLRVPVINGYVPEVSRCRLESGGMKIVYDYTRRITLDECLQCEEERPVKAKARTNAPRIPIPEETPTSLKRPSEVEERRTVVPSYKD